MNERALEPEAELPVLCLRVHVDRRRVRGTGEAGSARQTRELLALEEVAPRAVAAHVRTRERALAARNFARTCSSQEYGFINTE